MTDITANATVYPSANDIAEIEKEGRFATEQSHTDFVQKWMKNHIVSGFVLPASDPDLTITIPLGTAIVDGHRVVISAGTDILLAANDTNFIFLQISFDINNRIDSVDIISNTTGAPPVSSVKIGEAVTDATTVTGTTDTRDLGPYLDESIAGPQLNTHLGGVDINAGPFTSEVDLGSPVTITRKDLAGRDTKVSILVTGQVANGAGSGASEYTISIKDGATLIRSIGLDIIAGQAGNSQKDVFAFHDVTTLLGSADHSIKVTGTRNLGGGSLTVGLRLDVFAIGKG